MGKALRLLTALYQGAVVCGQFFKTDLRTSESMRHHIVAVYIVVAIDNTIVSCAQNLCDYHVASGY